MRRPLRSANWRRPPRDWPRCLPSIWTIRPEVGLRSKPSLDWENMRKDVVPKLLDVLRVKQGATVGGFGSGSMVGMPYGGNPGDNPEMQRQALLALLQIGPPAKVAIPVLKQYIDQKGPYQENARELLKRLEAGSNEADGQQRDDSHADASQKSSGDTPNAPH